MFGDLALRTRQEDTLFESLLEWFQKFCSEASLFGGLFEDVRSHRDVVIDVCSKWFVCLMVWSFVLKLVWLSICRCVSECLRVFEGRDFESGRIVE